jgi:zinc protease
MLNPRRCLPLALALLLPLSTPAFAQDAKGAAGAAAGGALSVKIPFEKYTLKNGLEVILSEDHRLPLVSTNIWYHVGPANERPDRTGFAHLFEHLMFEGSKNVGPKAHFKNLEAAGASDINGTTDFDRTNYFETLPANQLELALWLESDRMGYLQDTVDREKLANQRDVVRNERRQSIENSPYGLVEEALFHELFPKGHPYYASVIGSHADIEAARLSDVHEFFKQYYCPNNASLAIVGDFDKTQVKSLVEKYFGTLPSGPPVPKIEATTPLIKAEKRRTVTDQVELPRIYMAWITAPIFQPGSAEAELTARILGGGKSSRLYKKLVYEMQIAQDVSVENSPYILGSTFIIKATAKAGVKPEDLEKAINAELAAFRQNGPTASELEGARNTIEATIIGGLERLGGFGGVADRLNQYNHFLHDPGYLERDLQRYEQATTSDLKATAEKYLQDNSRVVIYGVPGKKVVEDVAQTSAREEKEAAAPDSKAPDEAWRKTPPKAGPEPRLKLPAPATFKIANGLTVYLLERHNLPLVSAQLAVLSGCEANPIDKPGLSSFTSEMLEYGTQKRSAMKIADDLELIGTRLAAFASPDSANVAVMSLSRTSDRAFDIFADVACHPVFNQKEIERLRSIRITSLQQEKDEPRLVARRVLYRVLYGAASPYGCVEDGTIKAARSYTRDDLVKFYGHGFVPSSAALIIVGDMTPEKARSFAEKYFGDWKGPACQPLSVPVKNDVQRTVYIVNKDAAPQTALTIGGIGMAFNNPDYVAGEVMNKAFGGMFSSRLNMNLREKHGYTYGAFSRFAYRRSPGPFAAGADVRTNITGQAVAEFFNEIEGMHKTPLSAGELKMAKDNISLSLPGQFESSWSAIHTLSNLFIYGLPTDYYSLLPAKINAINDADVAKVVGRYLKPQSMVVVAVGDRAKIEPELKKLNLGEIKQLDNEANPLK